MSKRANEEARIKDLKWKQAKMKEAEIEQRKRKFQMQ